MRRKGIRAVGFGMLVAMAVLVAGTPTPTAAQGGPILVQTAVEGRIHALAPIVAGEFVHKGAPVVFVSDPVTDAPVVGAVSPVDGEVLDVPVRPGSHVDVGAVVAIIRPY